MLPSDRNSLSLSLSWISFESWFLLLFVSPSYPGLTLSLRLPKSWVIHTTRFQQNTSQISKWDPPQTLLFDRGAAAKANRGPLSMDLGESEVVQYLRALRERESSLLVILSACKYNGFSVHTLYEYSTSDSKLAWSNDSPCNLVITYKLLVKGMRF